MKKILISLLMLCLIENLAIAAESKALKTTKESTTPESRAINVDEYNPNKPHSPTTFSTIESKLLTADQ
ncbi:Uncharacterised protein [Helicobacter fennelliae]|uniref:Periplasmic protein n=1 Tax=Helicobacter fennelliae TaxID=215 RepID=A0A2X3DKU1_9HELI|nr:hypothetical protein [Helicobacter fennelliae]SQB98880.1 Uncharacterised protein [Helicobacter fennelliae]